MSSKNKLLQIKLKDFLSFIALKQKYHMNSFEIYYLLITPDIY